MNIFCHHIYEYKKGLRNLVLHTLPTRCVDAAMKKLDANKIPFIIRRINTEKVNIFFGRKECVKVVESFGDKPLNEFTDGEDFILGIMLGYCRLKQCKRYLKRIASEKSQLYIASIAEKII